MKLNLYSYNNDADGFNLNANPIKARIETASNGVLSLNDPNLNANPIKARIETLIVRVEQKIIQ